MANMNLRDALNKALLTTKQYIDEETKLDNVLDLTSITTSLEAGDLVADEYGACVLENSKLFLDLKDKETEIKINLNNTISDKEYVLNINDFSYMGSKTAQEYFFQTYDEEIQCLLIIMMIYTCDNDIEKSMLKAYSVGSNEVEITINSFELTIFEYQSLIQSKMIESINYDKIANKPYPIINIEDSTNIAIPFTDWIRFNKYNLIDRRTTDINNTPYENSTGKNNTLDNSMNEINPIGTGIRVWNTAASGMENAKGLKFNISQELVDDINAGFIVFYCTFEAVNRPTMVRLVSPNGLYNERLIPFTRSHSGASTTGTFQLSFKTVEDYDYSHKLLAGDYYILFAVDDPEGANNCLVDLSNIVVYIKCYQDKDEIKVTRDIDKFIERDNKIPYEPTTDYSPATKKYVDDSLTMFADFGMIKMSSIDGSSGQLLVAHHPSDGPNMIFYSTKAYIGSTGAIGTESSMAAKMFYEDGVLISEKYATKQELNNIKIDIVTEDDISSILEDVDNIINNIDN